jgi:flagellar hook-associated protein 2
MTNFVNALGAGSGIDIKKLATDLMESTRAPRKAIIDDKIAKSEARISGYGVLRFSIDDLKQAFGDLNDLSDFASLQTSNSQPSAFGVTAGPTAAAAAYSVKVHQVAEAQRISTNGFAERSTSLNLVNGVNQPFQLSLTVGEGQAQTTNSINVTTATPAGIVSAINGAGLGLSAQLIQTSGSQPWKVVITGQTGEAQKFTLSSNSSVNLGLPSYQPDPNDANAPPVLLNASNWLQTAANANLEVNGLAVSRATNTINDVIDGVTFNLFTPTAAGSTARLELNRDTSGIVGKIEALVKAYKDFEDNVKIMSDRASEVEDFGGILAGDRLLQSVRSQVREMLTAVSSTPGSTIKAPRDVGLTFDRNGVLQLDKDKLAAALQNNFDEVAQMFSANTNNQSTFSAAPAGVAGDAVKKLDGMLRSTGLIAQQTDNTNKQIDQYKAQLERLEDQMQKLLERYMRQFTAMESIVGSSNSLRESLKGTFEGMANAYKN